MSYEDRGKAITLLSARDIDVRYVAVKKTSNNEEFDLCGADDVPIGILQTPTKKGTAGAVLINGVSFAIAADVIAAGAPVAPTTGGKIVAAGDAISFGTALNGATASGDIISVLLQIPVVAEAVGPYIPISEKGVAGGVASLDAEGIVVELPEIPQEVIEIGSVSDTAPLTPVTGDTYYNTTSNLIFTYDGDTWDDGVAPEAERLYIDLDGNLLYRWDGEKLVEIPSSD